MTHPENSLGHTPGPWLLEKDGRIVHEETRGSGHIHRHVLVHHVFGRGNEHLGEWWANALLIHAAPDLLAAARYAVDYPLAIDAREVLDAAIAKAEGRDS